MAYPAEYVIRIYKGDYPRHAFDQESFEGSEILDVGFGDGRNLTFLASLGFRTAGVEIDEGIVENARSNLDAAGVDADLRTGSSGDLPFDAECFDHLLSWNSCYYMEEGVPFDQHVREFARVLRDDAYLVLSVPKATCFIYEDCKPLGDGLVEIQKDPFGIRHGTVLRRFQDLDELVEAFSGHFYDFRTASVEDDCFGLNYHWHLIVCRRRPRETTEEPVEFQNTSS